MSEGYNPFPGLLQADDTCALQNMDTSGLDEGCLAYVHTKAAGPTAAYHYFRYYAPPVGTPPTTIDGIRVLSTYNGPEALQPNGSPCALQGNLRSDAGLARWILTGIAIVD